MHNIRLRQPNQIKKQLNSPLARLVEGRDAEADEATSRKTCILDDELCSVLVNGVNRRIQQPAVPTHAEPPTVFVACQDLPSI